MSRQPFTTAMLSLVESTLLVRRTICPAVCWLLGLAAIVAAPCATQAASLPIPLVGWQYDVIAEKTAGSPAAGTTADHYGNTFGGDWVFYENGSPNSPWPGLPSSGSFVSAFNSNVTFQFQPFTSRNAVVDYGTLVLTTPAHFSSLSFLVSGPESYWTPTLHFTDGSSTVLATTHDTNWLDNGTNALTTGIVFRNGDWSGYLYSSPVHMFEDDYSLSPADQLKTLVYMELYKVAYGPVDFFAVSGAPVPEPSAGLLLGLGLLGLAGRHWLSRSRRPLSRRAEVAISD